MAAQGCEHRRLTMAKRKARKRHIAAFILEPGEEGEVTDDE